MMKNITCLEQHKKKWTTYRDVRKDQLRNAGTNGYPTVKFGLQKKKIRKQNFVSRLKFYR